MASQNRAVTPKDHQKLVYQQLVKQRAPAKPIFLNALRAFLIGGSLCALAQIALNAFKARGVPLKDAVTWTSTLFIALGCILTGLGVYDVLGKVGGMGSALPISGFANSMAAPAMEFKREGWVLGVGARIFSVAGPVILYGLTSAAVISAIRYLMGGLGK